MRLPKVQRSKGASTPKTSSITLTRKYFDVSNLQGQVSAKHVGGHNSSWMFKTFQTPAVLVPGSIRKKTWNPSLSSSDIHFCGMRRSFWILHCRFHTPRDMSTKRKNQGEMALSFWASCSYYLKMEKQICGCKDYLTSILNPQSTTSWRLGSAWAHQNLPMSDMTLDVFWLRGFGSAHALDLSSTDRISSFRPGHWNIP